MEKLANKLQLPCHVTIGAEAWLTVGGIDPEHGPILQGIHVSFQGELVHRDTFELAVLFIGDEHSCYGALEDRANDKVVTLSQKDRDIPFLRKSGKKIRQQRNMSQAVGRAASVEKIAIDFKFEGVAIPS